MRIGDKDGHGTIYDNFGELILEPEEKIYSTGTESFGIITGWGEGGNHVFGSGSGKVFRTDKRIVLIRSPSAINPIRGGSPWFQIPGDMMNERDLETHNYFIFVEIMLNEIVGYKAGFFKTTRLCIYFNGKRYGLHFAPKKGRILTELIKSLSKVDRNLESEYYEIKKNPNIPHCDQCKSEDVYYYSEPDGLLIPYGLGKCNACNRVFQWKRSWL